MIGPSKAHAIVLRGDAIGVGQTAYGIERGGYTTFVEWGGVWRFRQIRDNFNNICFEINPLFVNVPTALRVANVDIDSMYQKRPWIHAIVNASGSTETTKGLNPITGVNRTSPLAGNWSISWNQPHPSGSNYIPMLSTPETYGFAYYTGRTSTSMSIITMTGSTETNWVKFSIMIPNH